MRSSWRQKKGLQWTKEKVFECLTEWRGQGKIKKIMKIENLEEYKNIFGYLVYVYM